MENLILVTEKRQSIKNSNQLPSNYEFLQEHYSISSTHKNCYKVIINHSSVMTTLSILFELRPNSIPLNINGFTNN